MLHSFALILISGFILGGIMEKFRLPRLLGMIVAGMILGPHALNFISQSVLNISLDLRETALIVILIRAGLALDIQDLKKVGRPAVLMSFIPATFELAAVTVFAPMFFGISYIEAVIMGTILAAVSPAVVVPRMLKLMECGYGKAKSIPQLILAGASVDDIYVIVLFTLFLEMYQGQNFDVAGLIKIPFSVVTGFLSGATGGIFLIWIFKKIHMRDTVKILILFSTAFLFISLENVIKVYVPLSGLTAVMVLGGTILKKYEVLAKRLAGKYSKLWVGAELFLFVLVGAAVDIDYIGKAGLEAVALIFIALILRMSGVFICLIKTKLNIREKLFCAISYLPKATVQAAIGGIPLAVGVEAGNIILTTAVVAIIITVPLGAIGVDIIYDKLLSDNND